MKELKKYFKAPPRETAVAYGVGAVILLAAFVVLYFTVGKTLRGFVTDTDSFRLWLSSYERQSAAIFVFIRAFQTVIKIIPAEPLEIASGYVFGTWMGTLYCSLGSLIGTVMIILLSKWLGGRFISAFINERQLREIPLLENRKKQRLFLIIFYLIPGTPKDLLTYVAGSTGINLGEFLIITTVCRLPSIITSTICGSQLESSNYTAAAVIFAVTAALSLICGVIYKKHTAIAKARS